MTQFTEEDKQLLHWYFYGFNDELGGKNRNMDATDAQIVAYKVGGMHARLGDDIPSLDYMSDAETLNIIRNAIEHS
jgi:hypothetical protein